MPDINWNEMWIPSLSLFEIFICGSVVYLALFLYLRMLRRGAGGIGLTDAGKFFKRPVAFTGFACPCRYNSLILRAWFSGTGVALVPFVDMFALFALSNII